MFLGRKLAATLHFTGCREDMEMKSHTYKKLWTFTALLVFSLALFVGCAKKRAPESVMDTPEHHTNNGMRSFDKGEVDEAQREFKLALELDPKYGPAHVGMGLVNGAKYLEAVDKKEKEKLLDQAFDSLKDGKKYAEGKEQKVFARVGYIRVYTMTKPKGWLGDAKQNFEYAVLDDEEAPAPYYYMGEAYKQSFEFSKAADMYRKVLDLDTEYTAEANQAWELVQKIERAKPGTAMGKLIALVEAITRADVAALFIEELKLEEVYEKLNVKTLPAELSNALFKRDVDLPMINYANDRIHFEIFISGTPDMPENPVSHTCISVADRDDLVRRCKAAGAGVIEVPKGDSMLVFISDFDGNLFEVKADS